jgi:tetratricopeptide (TPR) repeat protein
MSFTVLLLPLLLAQSAADGPVQGVAAMREGSTPRRTGTPSPNTFAESRTFAEPSRLHSCLSTAAQDPDAAEDTANAWLRQATGSQQAEPRMCLGWAYSTQQRWDDATRNFVAGRDIAAASDRVLRARLGAMAGNSSLADGAAARALPLLDVAHADARAAGDTHLAGDIEIDRARALVALRRDGDAATALAEARTASPDNAYGWLLSATLSRRLKQYAQAQSQIETAAQLAPRDPEIGLEAGVIAMLSGHGAAAAKSWQSVITAAPNSPSADTARGYLAQLASAPATPGLAAPAPATTGR